MFGHGDQDDQAADQSNNAVVGSGFHAPPYDTPAPPIVQSSAHASSVHDSQTQPTPTPQTDLPEDVTDKPAPASNNSDSDLYESNDLINIKQQALTQLSPLVGHLDQTPEEKFRTTMMMIQASDDASMIKAAYEAAQSIGDEKARAQALLDIVNEINYFTQSDDNK